MKTNDQLRQDIELELRWSPDLDEKDIAVKVDNGVVALSGYVRSYLDKTRAESAAKRVSGVAGVANDLQVRLPDRDQLPDPDLALKLVTALRSQAPEAAAELKVLVRDGQVTVEGELEWNYQRDVVEAIVRQTRGVKGLVNLIRIKPRIAANDVKRSITQAFHRSAQLDANSITVTVSGGQITLSGTVRTWFEHDQAAQTAWSAPGVTAVHNEIQVTP